MSTKKDHFSAIRRRLEKLELEHLRVHAAELAEKVDQLQAYLDNAEMRAESWRDDYFNLVEETLQEGQSIGLSKDGSLHVIETAMAS